MMISTGTKTYIYLMLQGNRYSIHVHCFVRECVSAGINSCSSFARTSSADELCNKITEGARKRSPKDQHKRRTAQLVF